MPVDPRHSETLPESVIAALARGNRIEAIKQLRAQRGLGLKEAKDTVDDYLRTQPALQRKLAAAQAAARKGCLRWLAILLFLLAWSIVFLLVK
jgi:ribosomal protein L7/L12